jgi:hypothetical protein
LSSLRPGSPSVAKKPAPDTGLMSDTVTSREKSGQSAGASVDRTRMTTIASGNILSGRVDAGREDMTFE